MAMRVEVADDELRIQYSAGSYCVWYMHEIQIRCQCLVDGDGDKEAAGQRNALFCGSLVVMEHVCVTLLVPRVMRGTWNAVPGMCFSHPVTALSSNPGCASPLLFSALWLLGPGISAPIDCPDCVQDVGCSRRSEILGARGNTKMPIWPLSHCGSTWV